MPSTKRVRAQLRDDVPLEIVPVRLLNCVMGDQFTQFLFESPPQPPDQVRRALEQRLALFYRSVLRAP